jgi:hypothetical protein
MAKYHVEVMYCSNKGNPCSKKEIVEAKTITEATDKVADKVRSYKSCMKIVRVDCVLI